MKLCGFKAGPDRPLFLIAGPCVVESEALTLSIAGQLKELTAELGVPFIFKASYDKANRSSRESYPGPGIEEGLRILAEVKRVRKPVVAVFLGGAQHGDRSHHQHQHKQVRIRIHIPLHQPIRN